MTVSSPTIWFVILSFVILGCVNTDGDGRYRVETIGNAKRSIEAVVLSSQSVLVRSSTTGVGGVAGGTTGGIIAANNSDNPAIIFAGILGGVIVGDAIERAANVHDATEYVIENKANAIFTVVQINKNNPIFEPGDKVILVYGYPSRLIKDPR